MIGEVDGYIKESNGNKYLTFATTDSNKNVLEKYAKRFVMKLNIISKQ